ncbi:hypothetical protein [Pedobacter sp. R-06]|uniref:hypothetical protein n=1 Tax=Pedobacter sp. R-06 TaxID=3404051 RepID=UPI003CF98579
MQKHFGNDSPAIRFTAYQVYEAWSFILFRAAGRKTIAYKGQSKGQNPQPHFPKPGSNGNPFYCLKWIRLNVLPDVFNLQ